MSLTRAERTTTINYDEDGLLAEVTTYSVSLIKSLRKNEAVTEVATYPEGGVRFQVSKRLVSVRNPRKAREPRAPMTDEEKQAASVRMAAARSAKKGI